MSMMHIIPLTVLDNFLDEPDKIRAWALQQEYLPSKDGQWPGLRTKPLHELDTPFFQLICRKFLSQFYDIINPSDSSGMSWEIKMYFQMVSKSYDSGWVHSDELGSQITGIVYLSPNANLNGGTSIYRNKFNIIQPVQARLKNSSNESKKDSSLKEDHNSQYEETIRVSNVYNRLVSFDSHLFHTAQDFFGEGQDSRLTLVFFVDKLFVNNSPISRVRRMISHE